MLCDILYHMEYDSVFLYKKNQMCYKMQRINYGLITSINQLVGFSTQWTSSSYVLLSMSISCDFELYGLLYSVKIQSCTISWYQWIVKGSYVSSLYWRLAMLSWGLWSANHYNHQQTIVFQCSVVSSNGIECESDGYIFSC